MEVLAAILALFALIAFPIAVLCHLAALRGSIDRTNELLSRVGSDLADVRREVWRAKGAESKPRAETAEGSSSPPSERGVARSAGGSTPCRATPEQAIAMSRTEYSPSLAPLGSPLSEGAGYKTPPPLPSVAAGAAARADARAPSPAKPPCLSRSGEPEEPTKLEQWTAAAWNWLRVGEEWRPGWIPGQYAVAAVQLLRAAALLLLFGAAWFVRYVHEQGWFSPAGRVAAGFAVAAALVAGGSAAARRRYRPLGLALAGIGLALGEFVDWAGANLYGVLPAPAAFAVAAALALLAGAMAWRHASLFLALVALFAGYTAPPFFPEAVRGGGDAPLLAWLLVLSAEAAALAVARGWRCLPWLSGAACLALAAPVFASDARLAALGSGAAAGFALLSALLGWVQALGHALQRGRAPFWFDGAAFLAAAALGALAGSAAAADWTQAARGVPCLALAAGCAGFAAAFARRGVRERAVHECFGGAGAGLVLAFLSLSFSGSARCALLCAAAVACVAAASRWRSSVQAALAPLAWVLWLSFVGAPATGAERVLRIGPAVASLWASGLLLLRAEPRGDRVFAPGFLWCAWAASLAWGSWEVRNGFPDAAPALALFWSVFALATLVAGLRFGRRGVRGAALVLFGLAAAKFLFVDQAGASTPERVAGFLGVGLLLLLGSAGYIRASAQVRPDRAAPPRRGPA